MARRLECGPMKETSPIYTPRGRGNMVKHASSMPPLQGERQETQLSSSAMHRERPPLAIANRSGGRRGARGIVRLEGSPG